MNIATKRRIFPAVLAIVALPLVRCGGDEGGNEQPIGPPASGGSLGKGGTGAAGQSSGGAGSGQGGGNSGGAAGSAAGGGGAPNGGSGGGSGSGGSAGLGGELNLYWVDVEGGAATIIHAPNGKVLLVDTGNPGGRDSGRILDVLENQLQAARIDHLIISHYHGDHVGGATEVAAGIDVVEFIDHGDSVESGQGTSYPALADGRRRTVMPGDTVDVGQASLTIVASNAAVIQTGLAGDTPNPACDGAEIRPKTGEENGASVGYVLSFGNFQFMDLGDLTWGSEHELVCPTNKIGEIELMQVPHHGLEISSAPQLFQAVNPLVAVASNGPTKGNAPQTYDRLMAIPALEHVWLIHRSEQNDAEHNPPDDRIANLVSGGGDEAHFIHARVTPDGAFTIENSRNAHSVSYQAR